MMSFAFEVHGKDEFFQANQILVPHFRLFGIKKTGRRRKHRAFLAKKETANTETIQKKKRVFLKRKEST